MRTLRTLGELAAIERVTKRLPGGGGMVVGAGDDCAVVRPAPDAAEDWLLTSDPVVEGIHFAADALPADIGRKALGRVLSDIAAMGGIPRWGLVDLVMPSDLPVETLDGLYDGIIEMATAHAFTIAGGDMSAGPVLELHVFGVGAVPAGAAVQRGGAQPGDLLFVTGELGGRARPRDFRIAPRVREGQWLRGRVTAMIDISDGLAADARHLAAAGGVGCDLNAAAIPVSAAARGAEDGVPPLDHALHDGEDFELLFTIPEAGEAAFTAAWTSAFALPCTRIGIVTTHRELLRCVLPDGETLALEGGGFSHFTA